jgi:hypothetical protein
MSKVHLSAERLIDAPADVVYRCIADYERHHRPGGFLPPQFHDFQILRGGVGAGTLMTFKVSLAGRTRTVTHEVTEPEPGRVLIEGDALDQTTFTVEPAGMQSRVRFDTLLDARGIQGFFTRLLAPRLMQPLYAHELERLEKRAQAELRLETVA